jgi:hypothetical protein
MLMTIAVVVIILCLLGLVTGYTISNFVHILSHCHYRHDGQSHSGTDAHFDANELPRIKVRGSKTFCDDKFDPATLAVKQMFEKGQIKFQNLQRVKACFKEASKQDEILYH